MIEDKVVSKIKSFFGSDEQPQQPDGDADYDGGERSQRRTGPRFLRFRLLIPASRFAGRTNQQQNATHGV
jgi:hypothetical protein